jgi:hypothetical protein
VITIPSNVHLVTEQPAAGAELRLTRGSGRTWRRTGTVVALLVGVLGGCGKKTANPSPVTPPPIVKPLLIEHGFDAAKVDVTAKNAAKIDALPFDGITILPAVNPCSVKPIDEAAAQADMAAMPKFTKVVHNFLLCRIYDDGEAGKPSPYDVNNVAAWTTIASNLAIYAKAAQTTGMFDGIMIDTEYYGKGPNPWDYDTIPTPLDYAKAPVRPWALPNDAKMASQARGKQVADAIKEAWPTVVIFSLRGAAISDKASYRQSNMGGNDVAWANELAGPFFVGMVESVAGSKATLIDGGESYYQRTPRDFEKAYAWQKSGLADSNGPLVPSGPVTPAVYKSTVLVASQTMDGDIRRKEGPYTPAQLQSILTAARKSTDKYVWLFSELYDWRGTGAPKLPASQAYLDAVAASRG